MEDFFSVDSPTPADYLSAHRLPARIHLKHTFQVPTVQSKLRNVRFFFIIELRFSRLKNPMAAAFRCENINLLQEPVVRPVTFGISSTWNVFDNIAYHLSTFFIYLNLKTSDKEKMLKSCKIIKTIILRLHKCVNNIWFTNLF